MRGSQTMEFSQTAGEVRPASAPLWLFGVIAFPIAIILLGQGITTPLTKDQEPQYAQWIESAAHGSLLLQRDYYGGPAEKPPLFFVTSAAVVKLSGGRVNEANSRAVSLIAGAALATLLMIWTASTIGMWRGLLALLFIVGSYGFAARATLAQSDMLLAFFMFSSWLLIYPHFAEPPSSARTVLIGVVFGLGILTKGRMSWPICFASWFSVYDPKARSRRRICSCVSSSGSIRSAISDLAELPLQHR